MDREIKVLIYGSGNVNPINILLENIRKYTDVNYKIDGLNLYQDQTIKLNHYKHFDNLYIVEKESLFKIPKSFLKEFFIDWFRTGEWKEQIRFLFLLKIKTFVKVVKLGIQDKFYRKQHADIFNLYDIINLQCVNEERASIIVAAPKKCKILLSFWGSDLMAFAGVQNYKLLLDAIRRADLVTLHSLEMREIFLSKFGRNFKNKVKLSLLGQKDEVLETNNDKINYIKDIGVNLFESHGFTISNYKHLVKVGYNGFATQNHLTILEECAKLPCELKQLILFVIPMTYGATREYVNEIEKFVSETDLSCCILKEYLNKDEVISISYVCHIMLNLRDNDAFNNAMMETLIAGNVLISGGWLPYSELRRAGIYYHEIFDFNEIVEKLPFILGNLENELNNCSQNLSKVRKIVGGDVTGRKWNEIYKGLVRCGDC